jgi:hypothetical protein
MEMGVPPRLVSDRYAGRHVFFWLMTKPTTDTWQIFLLFEGTETTGWSRALVDSRSAYTSLREHLLRFIENPDEIGSALDPLDDDKSVSRSYS